MSLNFLNLSKEGNARLFSLVTAIFIVFVKELFSIFGYEFHGVLYAMYVFLTYLLVDSFARNTNLPKDAIFHHTTGIFIVVFGLLKMFSNPIFHRVITPYLYMEITTPLLHGAWILHNEKSVMNKRLATILFLGLIIIWFPFRLYWPTKTTLYLFFNSSIFKDLPLSVTEINIGRPFFFSFCVLQYFWLGKLIERLLQSEFFKTFFTPLRSLQKKLKEDKKIV
jgi:hypothetical protein